MKEIFITGIDTDIGKTIVTGLLAAYLKSKNINVITQKLVQTGCTEVSEDILMHRKIMKIKTLDEDKSGLTCPYIFKYPSSPNLAAKIEKRSIDKKKISDATEVLKESYDTVLIEGAGGLYVPLNDQLNIIEYIKENNYPVILVSSSQLGSINHTLLSLEALKQNNIDLIGVVYNRVVDYGKLITNDSLEEIKKHMVKLGYKDNIIDIGKIDIERSRIKNFDIFFN